MNHKNIQWVMWGRGEEKNPLRQREATAGEGIEGGSNQYPNRERRRSQKLVTALSV